MTPSQSYVYAAAVVVTALTPILIAYLCLRHRKPEKRERRRKTRAVKQRSIYLEKL